MLNRFVFVVVLFAVGLGSVGVARASESGGLRLIFVSTGSSESASQDFVVFKNFSGKDLDLKSVKLVKRTESGKESSLKSWADGLKIPNDGVVAWVTKAAVGLTLPVETASTTATLSPGNEVLLYADFGSGGSLVDSLDTTNKGVVFVRSLGVFNAVAYEQFKGVCRESLADVCDVTGVAEQEVVAPKVSEVQPKTEKVVKPVLVANETIVGAASAEIVVKPLAAKSEEIVVKPGLKGKEVSGSVIRIISVLADPAGEDDLAESVVLQNIDNKSVDLGGFVVSAGEVLSGSKLPAAVLDAGEKARVILDKSAARLVNGGGKVSLFDAKQRKIFEVEYLKAASGKWQDVTDFEAVQTFSSDTTGNVGDKNDGEVVAVSPVIGTVGVKEVKAQTKAVSASTVKKSKASKSNVSTKKEEEIFNLENEMSEFSKNSGALKKPQVSKSVFKNFGVWIGLLLLLSLGVKLFRTFREKFA